MKTKRTTHLYKADSAHARAHTHTGFTVPHFSEFALSAFQAGRIKQIEHESKLSLFFHSVFLKGSGGQTALMAGERMQCVAIEQSALACIQQRASTDRRLL